MQNYIKIGKSRSGSGQGYSLNIGNGKTAHAANLQEVVYGLEHYFRDGVPGYSGDKFDYQKHIEHSKVCSCCPLCREQS